VTPALADTLAMVAEAASGAMEPWWIIGSAAVVLHGRAVPHVKDVDLLMSAGDAEVLLRRVGAQPGRGEADERFRSTVFGCWTGPPIPIEVFGGFSVAVAGRWRDVFLSTRESVSVGGARVFVPSVEELVRLLHSFGRPKDLERAQLLQG